MRRGAAIMRLAAFWTSDLGVAIRHFLQEVSEDFAASCAGYF